MKIAVSGGTGFLGRPLVERLLAKRHQVIMLTRHPERARVPEGAQVACWNLEEPPAPALLKDVDAVVNLSGEPVNQRWTAPHKDRIFRSRVQGTDALVRAARESGTVQTVLGGSAIGYYGTHRDDRTLTEESPPGHDFLAEVCVAWEAALAPARDAGMRMVALRTGVVLHPEGGALRSLLLPFKLGAGGPVGRGTQWVSWIHREDALALYVHLLENAGVKGPVNITAPNPVTNRQLAHDLGEALHRPSVMPVPGLPLKLALGEMAQVVLEGQRVVPKAAMDSGFQFQFPELKPALVDLLTRA